MPQRGGWFCRNQRPIALVGDAVLCVPQYCGGILPHLQNTWRYSPACEEGFSTPPHTPPRPGDLRPPGPPRVSMLVGTRHYNESLDRTISAAERPLFNGRKAAICRIAGNYSEPSLQVVGTTALGRRFFSVIRRRRLRAAD